LPAFVNRGVLAKNKLHALLQTIIARL